MHSDITIPGFKSFTILFSLNFIFLFLLRYSGLIAVILELVPRFRIISCSLDNREAFTFKFLRKAASDVHLGKKSYLTLIETTFPFFFGNQAARCFGKCTSVNLLWEVPKDLIGYVMLQVKRFKVK